MVFEHRTHAGELLAQQLGAHARRDDAVVLALPRGGVPVGFAVAEALEVPLDILPVRKLGVPGHEEYAMGALASGGQPELQAEVPRTLRIPKHTVDAVARRALGELRRREKRYRAGRPRRELRDRIVILVDDGMATGCTMRAALHAVRREHPRRVIVALPVAAPEACEALRSEADEIVCLLTPESSIQWGAGTTISSKPATPRSSRCWTPPPAAGRRRRDDRPPVRQRTSHKVEIWHNCAHPSTTR